MVWKNWLGYWSGLLKWTPKPKPWTGVFENTSRLDSINWIIDWSPGIDFLTWMSRLDPSTGHERTHWVDCLNEILDWTHPLVSQNKLLGWNPGLDSEAKILNWILTLDPIPATWIDFFKLIYETNLWTGLRNWTIHLNLICRRKSLILVICSSI